MNQTIALAILDQPYASPALLSSLCRQRIPTMVLDPCCATASVEQLVVVDEEQAANLVRNPACRVLTNSENAIEFILKHAPDTRLAGQVRAVKDKALFRDRLASAGFWHRRVRCDRLPDLDPAELHFPLVMKPSSGFFSLGVRVVPSADDWQNAVEDELAELRQAGLDQSRGAGYPKDVLDTTEILLEEYIFGPEIAVDAFYGADGEPTVLNIYRHEFPPCDRAEVQDHEQDANPDQDQDLRDILYYTSSEVIAELHDKVRDALTWIGRKLQLEQFPVHVEFRETSDGALMPIEVNPVRFAGWGTADLGRFAFGFDTYSAYFWQQGPDWEKASIHAGGSQYAFVIGHLPEAMKSATSIHVDWSQYKAVLGDVIELREVDPLRWGIFSIAFLRADDVGKLREVCAFDPSNVLAPTW